MSTLTLRMSHAAPASHAGKNGSGTILEPAVRGAGQHGGGGADALQPASANDSGSSALLDPILLLVIGGVVAATAGMMLHRRKAEDEAPATSGGASSESASERPTPDGRIVNGEGGSHADASPDPPTKDES